MAARIGPLASQCCKLRQTRKGAAVVADASAGVWLVRGAAIPSAALATESSTAVPFRNDDKFPAR